MSIVFLIDLCLKQRNPSLVKRRRGAWFGSRSLRASEPGGFSVASEADEGSGGGRTGERRGDSLNRHFAPVMTTGQTERSQETGEQRKRGRERRGEVEVRGRRRGIHWSDEPSVQSQLPKTSVITRPSSSFLPLYLFSLSFQAKLSSSRSQPCSATRVHSSSLSLKYCSMQLFHLFFFYVAVFLDPSSHQVLPSFLSKTLPTAVSLPPNYFCSPPRE